MKILSAIHGPVYGGVHAQVARLHQPLAERGYDLLCLLPNERGTAHERIAAAGAPVVTLPLHRLRAKPDPVVQARFLGSLPPEVRAIRRLIRREGVDVVQAHGPTNPHVALAAHLESRAVVWQLPDTRAPMALRRATMPMVVRLADVITSVGEALAEAHPGAKGLGERMVPIYPPVDLDRFRPDAEVRAAARRELGIPEGALAVGTVANLNPSKGHEYLIRAAGQVRRSAPDSVFHILGAPSPPHPEYARLLEEEALASGLQDDGALVFTDPGTRVPELLPALDVFVLASVPRSEGMPTVIIEAMSCGIPTVATDVGAVREVVDHGQTGFVVPPENPRALAEALERLQREPGLRAGMGAAARRRAHERFGLDRLADLHADVYERAVRHRRNRAG